MTVALVVEWGQRESLPQVVAELLRGLDVVPSWLAWSSLVLLALARFMTTPISFETERAMLLRWFAGAAALAVVGGPSRRAPGSAVAVGLAAVDAPLRRLEQASLDARGSTPYFAEGLDDRRLPERWSARMSAAPI